MYVYTLYYCIGIGKRVSCTCVYTVYICISSDTISYIINLQIIFR